MFLTLVADRINFLEETKLSNSLSSFKNIFLTHCRGIRHFAPYLEAREIHRKW